MTVTRGWERGRAVAHPPPGIGDNGGVSLYRDEGVVLRTRKLGEADRIVTLLTRRTGLVRAVGKGVRRTKSRFGARLEPFTHVDLQLYTGRTLDVITQADTLHAYGTPIVADYARYTAGTAMLETAEKIVIVEKDPALRQFLLLIGGLRTLGGNEHDPRLVLDAYLLRSLAVAGYAPALDECARCGSHGIQRSFAVHAGGAVCSVCRPAGSASPAPDTLRLMVALLRGDWAGADASEERHRTECSGLVAAYLQWHLENGIRSLRLVERS
ncbi:DNA replication and repair protein RecO [Marinactinospora thermotolerans DSM 45154]|uniref:DNA repair protein RecO n=1 Tax=Marinactinospora thermotolerans DSM 45154 TaxID=1122192 RepID=A0A1T4LPV8_9ACTN|nr:DNA replication and repair protein RecO [Marinactinospora thermotolerans DSM 45154]